MAAKIDHVEASLSVRLDREIENTGSHYRRLEERVAALEAKVR